MNEHFLTEIEIKQFKCFTDFKASGFKRVNLIGGKNNIGKTALMEAIYINAYSDSLDTMFTVFCDVIRRRENFDTKSSFENLDILNAVKKYSAKSNLHENSFLSSNKKYVFNTNGKINKFNEEDFIFSESDFFNRTEKLSYKSKENIFFIHYFLDRFEFNSFDLVGIFKKINKNNEINFFIQEFDDSIDNILIFDNVLKLKVNNNYREIFEFGEGLKSYISIICALYACENGYLFIDEIDNGIYYEHFDRLWEIILRLSKETNCQVFATTHSKEMLESFARVAKKLDEQDVSYTRLVKNKKQELKSTTFDYAVLEYSFENAHEVR